MFYASLNKGNVSQFSQISALNSPQYHLSMVSSDS